MQKLNSSVYTNPSGYGNGTYYDDEHNLEHLQASYNYNPSSNLDSNIINSGGDLVRVPPTSCFSYSFSTSNVLYTIVFSLIILLSVIFKVLLNKIDNFLPFNYCESIICFAHQVVYRFSFTGLLFFMIMLLICFFFPKFHVTNWWFKFILLAALSSLSFLLSSDVFTYYRNSARYISVAFLLLQVILLINLAHSLHEYMLDKIDSEPYKKTWRYLYLSLFLFLFGVSIFGFVLLYKNFSSCATNTTIISIILAVSLFFIFACATETVNKGVLAPTVLMLYLTLIAYLTLSSNTDHHCRSFTPEPPVWLTVVLVSINLVTIFFKTSLTSNSAPNIILDNDLAPYDSDQQWKYMSKKNIYTFHISMMFACVYLSMSLTNWGGETYGSEINSSSFNQTFVIQLVYIFSTMLLFLWTIAAPLICVNRQFGSSRERDSNYNYVNLDPSSS